MMKRVNTLLAILAAAIALWNAEAVATESKIGDLTVVQPWARATASLAKTGAVFLTIKNNGAQADRLIAVKSAVAKKTGLHQSLMEGGLMKMRPAGAIEVPAGGMVMLKPGSYHVMFMGLKAPLKKGTSIALTLVFEKAGEIEVMAQVMKIGAMGAMNMGSKKMKHAD